MMTRRHVLTLAAAVLAPPPRAPPPRARGAPISGRGQIS
jgi:hypothetical protein